MEKKQTKKTHQLTVKLEAAERGNASTAVGFLWAQQMSPTDDICGAFTRQICAGLCQQTKKTQESCSRPVLGLSIQHNQMRFGGN